MRISDWSSDVCSSDLLHAARPAGEEVGEGKGQHHAAHRDHGGEQQGKPEHAAEEGAEEALVVVEDEVDAVEAALLAPEEADRDHGAEGNDEEYNQHRRRKDQRQLVDQRARPVASHCSSTTPRSAGSTTPIPLPASTAGRPRGVTPRLTDRDAGKKWVRT